MEFLPFIVAGIVTGSIYGLAGTGLVLTYRTSGIFNFGQGALASAGAYVFYYATTSWGLDWKFAVAIAVLGLGPLLGLGMELIARTLAFQRTAWQVVGTAGLMLVVQGLGALKYGPDPVFVPQFLPGQLTTFEVWSVTIAMSQVVIAATAAVIGAALYVLMRYTRLGIALRAVVVAPELVALDGTNPNRIRRVAWVIGSTLAALSGVLVVPLIGLDAVALTLLVVQTFAAAAIGLFRSIPLTLVGGVVIGVGEAILTKVETEHLGLLGISRGFPFILLILVMMVTPRTKLLAPTEHEIRPPTVWHGPPVLRRAAFVIVFAVLVSVPFWSSGSIINPYWTGALVFIILMMSLGLLVKTAGIVSLCTAAFAAIGAATFSHLVVGAGVPWLLGLLLAAAVAFPVGALLAVPAIRLSGMFLALATLGFGLFIERFFYARSFMFTSSPVGLEMPRPSWALSDRSYYWFVLALVAVSIALVSGIHRGRLGRLLLGMSDSPRAVTTLGLNAHVTRVLVFSVAASMAAVGGVLYGVMLGRAQTTTPVFSAFNSIVLLAILALAPGRAPWYAIIAGISQVIPGYLPGATTTYVMNVIFGVFAIVLGMQGGPAPLPARWRAFLDRRFASGQRRARTERDTAPHTPGPQRTPEKTHPDSAREPSGVSVRGLKVRFGGLVALHDVSLEVPMSRITGLIGPNGAGKSTLFNACSGLVQPAEGEIFLHGRDVRGSSPSVRARHGLGRTFQVMELCESLSVWDNVALGREAGQAGGSAVRQLAASPAEQQLRRDATEAAISLCGIEDLAHLQAGALSTGQRRLVELARCLAGPFDVLLLDEPSSGLDAAESQRFAAILRQVVAERGCGVLFVEHDVSLVLDVCAYIYVLDSGRLIFEGSPADVRSSPVVQSAYLGAYAETAQESG